MMIVSAFKIEGERLPFINVRVGLAISSDVMLVSSDINVLSECVELCCNEIGFIYDELADVIVFGELVVNMTYDAIDRLAIALEDKGAF